MGMRLFSHKRIAEKVGLAFIGYLTDASRNGRRLCWRATIQGSRRHANGPDRAGRSQFLPAFCTTISGLDRCVPMPRKTPGRGLGAMPPPPDRKMPHKEKHHV